MIGKTMMSLQISRNVAELHNVAYFTLKDSPEILTKTILAQESRMNVFDFNRSYNNEECLKKLKKGKSAVKKLNLDIYDYANPDFSDIRNQISTVVEHNGVKLVVIDSLEMFDFNKNIKLSEQYEEIALNLKKIASEEKIAIILNISSEHENYASQKTLRRLGNIEKHSDVVIALNLHQEEYFSAYLLKNNYGHDAVLFYDKECMRFVDVNLKDVLASERA